MKTLLLSLVTILSLSAEATFKRLNIVETAQKAGNFKTLLTALELTDLKHTVANTKDLTVFAPTDEAFEKLPQDTLSFLINNPEILKEILFYHVASEKLKAKKVLKAKEIKTLAGKTIKVSLREGKPFLNDSMILATDIKAKNGLIHVIDTVLTFDENTPNNEITTESYIELDRYLGKWYEIARYENEFQTGCLGTTATYGKRGKYITVENRCQKANGKVQGGKALATVDNTETNATLKVSFVPFFNLFGWFAGDYNILAIGPDYDYALVGDKARNNFWILARTKTLSDDLYTELLDIAASKGYRKELIRKSPIWQD